MTFRQSIKLVIFSIFILSLPIVIQTSPIQAQGGGGNCQLSAVNPIVEGLTSTPALERPNFKTSSGACVVNIGEAGIPLSHAKINIDTFAKFKRQFFDKAEKTVTAQELAPPIINLEQMTFNVITPTIYHKSGDFDIVDGGDADALGNPNPTSSGPGVIFVNGNLNIKNNMGYGFNNAAKGMVFIVSGDIRISSSIINLSGVYISYGEICTAYNFTGNSCPTDYVTASALRVDGSFISLGVAPIKFRRQLSDNTSPAEEITFREKYLVILKDFLAKDLVIFN